MILQLNVFIDLTIFFQRKFSHYFLKCRDIQNDYQKLLNIFKNSSKNAVIVNFVLEILNL